MNIKLNNFEYLKIDEKISFLLIVLLPISLTSGSLIPDLIVTICSLIFIYKIFKNINFREFLFSSYKKEILLFFIFYAIIIITLTNSTVYTNSFLPSFFYFRFFLFILIALYIFHIYPKIVFILAMSIIFIFVALFIDSFIQFKFKKNIFFQDLQNYTDLSFITSFFGNEKKLGSFIIRLLPVLISLIYFINNKFFNDYFIKELIVLISFSLIVLSSERMAIFNFGIFIFFYFFTFKNKNKIIFIILLSITTTSLYISFPNHFIKIYKTTINQIYEKESTVEIPSLLTRYKYSDKPLYYSRNHQNMLITSYNIFKENIFFGSGIKTFRVECKKEKYEIEQRCSTHPHNTYLQLLSETGIFTFIFISLIFLFLLFENLKILFKKNILSFEKSILMSNTSILIPLFPFVPSGSFYNNWISITLCFAFLINIYIKKIYT